MAVKIITAYTKNGRVIGKEGKLPWHLPDDMKHFKETTGNDPVIMGRKTYESIPENFRPLPHRLNIVISKILKGDDLFFDPTEPMYAKSVERALEICDLTTPGNDVWIIGGGQIYNYVLEKGLVEEIWASEVKQEYEGDVSFPELDGWKGEIVKSFNDFDVVKYVKQ